MIFQSQSHSYGGKNGSPPAVKYIPLPHHDLPVLIYQSVNKPPIHVVHTPAPATPYSPPKKQPYQGRTLCMTKQTDPMYNFGNFKGRARFTQFLIHKFLQMKWVNLVLLGQGRIYT